MASPKFTPGPWPMKNTGDGKRIIIGEGLVEGPNGYEVAEVYSDDCPREVAEANARLIAAAPDLYDFVATIENDDGKIPDWLWKKRNALLARARGGQS